MYVCICHPCTLMQASTSAWMPTCMHVCMHTYMHACIRACMHACTHACIQAHMHTHTCIQPLADLHVAKNRWYKSRSIEGEFVSTWRLAQCMHTQCMHAYVHAYICMHTYIHVEARAMHPSPTCMHWTPTRSARTYYRLPCTYIHVLDAYP